MCFERVRGGPESGCPQVLKVSTPSRRWSQQGCCGAGSLTSTKSGVTCHNGDWRGRPHGCVPGGSPSGVAGRDHGSTSSLADGVGNRASTATDSQASKNREDGLRMHGG
jgi:hypothetical protein